MMDPVLTRTLLLLLLFLPSLIATANFTQCLEDFKQNSSAVGGVDSRGRPVSPAEAVGLTYQTCTAQCGTDQETFIWKDFSQLFSSWLLPWLALLSQLPFGSSNYADDFVSVIMSLGSPALAAYSLVITSLNARLVYCRAKSIKHESKGDVARALISLQQTPLELTKDERLLAFIPINDRWRQEIADRLNRRNAWSLAAGSSVAWVLVAFVFTLADSFVSLDTTADNISEGHAVGTLWLWLLCLVIGWLWVPIFDSSELKTAVNYANHQAVKKAAKKLRKAKESLTRKAMGSAKIKLARKVLKRLRGSKKPIGSPITVVVEENEKEQSTQGNTEHLREGTDQKANPLPNPSHHQPAVFFQTHPESHQVHDYLTVSANPNAHQSVISMDRSAQNSIDPKTDKLLISQELTSLNRDEHRLTATFNYSRLIRYLVFVDDVLTALDKLALEKDEKRESASWDVPTPFAGEKTVVFPRGAFTSMFNAAVTALILQCGTTAAATIIIFFTPTVGLGCRSLGYTIYGAIAILIMFLTIISTIFARISETRKERRRPITIATVKCFTAFIAIALRRISFLLALINGVGLIVLSCFQFSHFLDNCYCNASVITRGTNSFIIAVLNTDSVTTMRNSRIIGTALSGVVMVIYMVFIWLTSVLPVDIGDF